MKRHYIIPIFVPHFGCPHDCIFCNQDKITGLTTNIEPSHVEKIIEDHISTFQKNAFIEIAFYGGSFTAIDIPTQKKLLEVPLKYKEEGIIDEIRLSTRPDAINDAILKNLKKYKVNTIELGVQSLDETVLDESYRGHNSVHVYEAANLIRDYGFKLGLQMMLGLPGDNIHKSIKTCEEFIKLKPDCVRIYPTLVIKETLLEELYLIGKYKPLCIEEAVDISTILLMKFYTNNINVIRIGLQPTENIQLGKDVVAGPFHPAFRQLVESNVFKIIFEHLLHKNNIKTYKETMIISCNARNVSNIAGHKASNKKYLIDKFEFNNIKIIPSDINPDCIYISINEFRKEFSIKSLIKSYLDNT